MLSSISKHLFIAYGSSQKQIVSALAALAISSAMIGAGALGLFQACFSMKGVVLSAFSWIALGSGFGIAVALFCIGAYRIYQDKSIKQKAALDQNFWDLLEKLENSSEDKEKLKNWVERGANLHSRNKLKQTPLIYLLLNKDLDTDIFSQMANILLENQVDVHALIDGKSAMHWLIESSLQWSHRDGDIIVSRLEWLMRCHVDINQKDGNGNTALHMAVEQPESNYSILWINQLLQHQADETILDKQGYTPLQKIQENRSCPMDVKREITKQLEGR